MGCDIHTIIQYKRSNGEWSIENTPEEIRDKWEPRNYVLFSILADVRNFYHDIKPICIPRGIPKDFCKIDIDSYNDDDNHIHFLLNGGTHSRSYLTLKDLKEYDWDQIISAYGCDFKTYCSDFYNNLIPKLQELSDKYGGDENVRIVFSFDN